MPAPRTTRPTKGKRAKKRGSLADDVPPVVRDDGELIPGLRPALIANPGLHPSREVGRRRRSGISVPGLIEPSDQPDDTEGRVTFFFGEALLDSDPIEAEPEPDTPEPVADTAAPIGWLTVALVAVGLVMVFVVGIELLK